MSRITAVLAFIFVFVCSACETITEPEESTSPATHGEIRVQVDGGSCDGKVVNVDVFIDGQIEGRLQPGAGRITKLVPIGNHTLGASAERVAGGTTNWSPITRNVQEQGVGLNLTCN